MVWHQEIKPKLDGLYTEYKKLKERIEDLEYNLEAHKEDNNKFLTKAAANLTVESLNKIMQQHIEGTSMPIKNKIEEVVEEYNAHLTKLKENAYRIKKEACTIKEILIYEEELDYIISHMNRLYGNSKKGA